MKVLTNALRLSLNCRTSSDVRPEVGNNTPGHAKRPDNESTHERPRQTIDGLFANNPAVGGTWPEQAFAAQLSFGANGLVAGKYYQHAVQGNWTPLNSTSLIFTVDSVEAQDGTKMQWEPGMSASRWERRITSFGGDVETVRHPEPAARSAEQHAELNADDHAAHPTHSK